MTARRKITRDVDGAPLCIRYLPQPGCHWTPKRKANLVLAVRGGLISLAAVTDRYRITPLEFEAWQRDYKANGVAGLRLVVLRSNRQAQRTGASA